MLCPPHFEIKTGGKNDTPQQCLGQVRPGHWAEGGTAERTKAPALQALALHALYNTYPPRRRRRPKEEVIIVVVVVIDKK